MEHVYEVRSTQAAQRGLALIMSAAVLWGTVGVATQAIFALTPTNPLSIGFFRLALATPFLGIAAWRVLGRGMLRIARRDLALMLLIGAMLGLYQACFFAAITYSGVTIATLVTLCTAPVLVAGLSAVVTGERITRAVATALAVALLGTALLVGVEPWAGGARATLLGGLLALGSGLGYAVLAICSRLLAARYHPLQTNLVAFATGALLLLLLAVPTGFVVQYPTASWLLLLYLGVVPTAIGYVLFLAGMRSTPATVASIATLLEPLTATLLAWALFGERLGALGALGALLLVGAMVGLGLQQPRPRSRRW